MLDRNYASCRSSLNRALKIVETHEGAKSTATIRVREHLGLLAYPAGVRSLRLGRRPFALILAALDGKRRPPSNTRGANANARDLSNMSRRYYEAKFDEAQDHFRNVHDILVAAGRPADDPDVVRQVENIATATCRQGPRTWE